MLRKLHFKTKEKFLEEVNGDFLTPSSGSELTKDARYGNLYGTDLVFIKDTGEIWTHGAFYGAMEAIDMIAMLDLETEDDYKNCIDLSYVDINGNSLETQSTANCYVVHQRGLYKFPLVYGNAIKNGEDNQSAYVANIPEIPEGEGEGGEPETPITESEFINYMGVKITSPYIEEDLADMNEKLTVENAFLIWSDEPNVISDIELIEGEGCRYVQFKLRNVSKNGANAIIGIRGKDEDIIWSWHIWIFPEQLEDIHVVNNSGEFDVLNYNLGTKFDGSKEQVICNYYQWGRKDPFMRDAFWNRNMTTVLYDESGNIIEFRTNSRPLETYFHYIIYPNVMWDSVGTYMQKCTNYWNSNKTIYDPCPIGYRVPTKGFYNGFVDEYFDEESAEIKDKWNIIKESFAWGCKFKINNDDLQGMPFKNGNYLYLDSEDYLHIQGWDIWWNNSQLSAGYIRPLKDN